MTLHLREIIHVCEVQNVGMLLNMFAAIVPVDILYQNHQNCSCLHDSSKVMERGELSVGGTTHHTSAGPLMTR